MSRTHQRTEFYKLATLHTARIIVASRSLRWSSPLRFNDPFDTQTHLVARDFDGETFSTRFLNRLLEIVNGEQLPAFYDPNSKLHEVAMQLRNCRDMQRKEEGVGVLRRSAFDIPNTFDAHMQKFSNQVTEQLRHGRVFCLTEEINNVVMWSHYADEHRGVGLKLRCLDELDHPFLIAKPVEYSDRYLSVGNAIELADHFSRANRIDLESLIWRIVFLKHQDWAYEKEWRCYFPLLNEPPGDGYTVHSQHPRLFEAIYLGCRMEEQDVEDMTALIRLHLPGTRIYRARKGTRSFDLEFVEL